MNETIESYVVRDTLYVNTKFLKAYFNRTEKQIGRWKKDGLPVATKPKEINQRGDYYILEEVIVWVSNNVNQTKASNSKSSDSEGVDLEDEEKLFDIYSNGNAQQKRRLLLRLNQNRLDNFKKIEDIVEKEAKNKEYDAKYALKDDVKKGQQELASLFISLLKNSLPVLSSTLENKTQDEIYHLMDSHFKKEMQKIVRYINKHQEYIVTLDEVINFIVHLVSEKDVEQKEIILKLDELNKKA